MSVIKSFPCPPGNRRYAVLGDIHANLEALLAVLEDARRLQCTHYACVGDVIGYHASPRECIQIVRNVGMPCVKGNHDEYGAGADELVNVSPRAAMAIRWTRQQLHEEDKRWLGGLRYVRMVGNFSMVHATLDAPQRWAYVFDKLQAASSFTYQTTPLCFFGHTHLPMAFTRDSSVRGDTYSRFKLDPGCKYFVNVGSVGEPRDGDPRAAYVVYDSEESSIELRRIAYDFAEAQAKDDAAGLPARRRILS